MRIVTQTTALLVDAYRELNAKKLFWVALGLNAIMIAVFAGLGISETGPTFFHWTFDNPVLRSSLISPELFYKLQFTSWGVPFLSWFSTILALVSTAAMIPDLITGGSIETLLSKPIGRARLLLTKFATGLLFVALQVGVFTIGCFLVMWLRGGAVEPSLFLAIPIVVAVFSYLFSVCVLLGLLTRSTIASLLLTFVFWGMVFVVNLGDSIVSGFRAEAELRYNDAVANVERQEAFADRLVAGYESRGEEILSPDGEPVTDPDERRLAVSSALQPSLDRVEERSESLSTWDTWSGRVTLIKSVFPKTQETVGLLERHLISEDDLEKLLPFSTDDPPTGESNRPLEDPRVQAQLQQDRRDRPLAWILGTSLAFEAVILGLALIIFVRRDF